MRRPDLGRLRWRLLAANLAVAAAAVAAITLGVWLAAPLAFESAMGRNGTVGGSGGMMGGTGSSGMMDPLLRSAFGDAVAAAIWLGLAAATAVAVVVSLLLATRLSRPIDDLAAASRRVAAGDYSRPVPPGDGELGELAVAFNTMAAGLAAEERRRRDLVGDVAHELRTPIASVRGYVEGLQAGVFAPGPDAWHVLGEQTARLERLVDDLATLWHVESAALSLAVVTVDAAAAIGAARARHLAAAAAHSIAITADSRAVPLLADPDRLGQVLDNLVANAVRYGREGGTVTLAARRDGPRAVVSVVDDGPGIAQADLPRVFERFYRADPSRSRDAGGSGLGLAISKSLVEAMGGTISASSPGPGGSGAVFEVSLAAA